MGCVECDDDLDHCHGTWIVHRDDTGECTVAHCHAEVEGHTIVVDCVEVHVDCDQLQ